MVFVLPVVVLLLLLVPGAPASAQVRLEVSAGAAGSGIVIRNAIATGSVHDSIPGVQDEVTARFAASPRIGLGVVLPMRARTEAVIRLGWSPSALRANDGTDTRDVTDVTILEAVFGVRARVWREVEVSGGFGGLHFSGSDTGPFAGGADIAPLLEGSVGAGMSRGSHRLHVRALAQMHRFSTEALQTARLSGGTVLRFGIETSLTWKGGAR